MGSDVGWSGAAARDWEKPTRYTEYPNLNPKDQRRVVKLGLADIFHPCRASAPKTPCEDKTHIHNNSLPPTPFHSTLHDTYRSHVATLSRRLHDEAPVAHALDEAVEQLVRRRRRIQEAGSEVRSIAWGNERLRGGYNSGKGREHAGNMYGLTMLDTEPTTSFLRRARPSLQRSSVCRQRRLTTVFSA